MSELVEFTIHRMHLPGEDSFRATTSSHLFGPRPYHRDQTARASAGPTGRPAGTAPPHRPARPRSAPGASPPAASGPPASSAPASPVAPRPPSASRPSTAARRGRPASPSGTGPATAQAAGVDGQGLAPDVVTAPRLLVAQRRAHRRRHTAHAAARQQRPGGDQGQVRQEQQRQRPVRPADRGSRHGLTPSRPAGTGPPPAPPARPRRPATPRSSSPRPPTSWILDAGRNDPSPVPPRRRVIAAVSPRLCFRPLPFLQSSAYNELLFRRNSGGPIMSTSLPCCKRRKSRCSSRRRQPMDAEQPGSQGGRRWTMWVKRPEDNECHQGTMRA